MATNATSETFDSEVLEADGKILVDFWAEWCGPCHAVAPVLDRIADEHQVKVVKVNIDEQQDLAQRYGVASIPFMVLFENGAPQASAVGAMPKGSLEKALGLVGGRGLSSRLTPRLRPSLRAARVTRRAPPARPAARARASRART